MKRILITGKNSYIGNKFEEWVSQWPDDYQVDKISVRDDSWKEQDWSIYDVILHVAGIAHNSSKKSLEDLYYKVNRDLTVSIAKKAKSDGVKHFIFMSSIIVFGTKNECIDKDTVPDPDNFYGDSKLQAERELEKLVEESFSLAIVRPPMVYGEGSKGNFPLLVKLTNFISFFPNYNNKRSMVYIDNLSEFLNVLIKANCKGISKYHPQNSEYVSTSVLVKQIANKKKKKMHLIKNSVFLVNILKRMSFGKKIFGNLYYFAEDFVDFDNNYQVVSFEESLDFVKKIN